MAGIVSGFIENLKWLKNKKGQGIVEFALLCAFCGAIAIFMRDAGFSEAFNGALEKSKPELHSAAIALRPRNNYMDYYYLWSTMSKESIRNAKKVDGTPYTNDDRIEADQKALVKIAETYLGKSESQILTLMDTFTNSLNDNTPDYVNALKCKTGTGFSNGVLVPLSYKENTLEKNGNNSEDADRKKGWLWWENNNNQNTVAYLTNNEAKTYDKYDTNNPTYSSSGNRQTATTDRLFYSDDMLDSDGGRITLRLHYTDGKVDFVDVALRYDTITTSLDKNGKLVKSYNISNDSPIAEGLCLHVTQSGHNVIEDGVKETTDIVRSPTTFYNTDGTRITQ